MMFLPINQEQETYAMNLAEQITTRFQGQQGLFEGKQSLEANYLGMLTQTVIADYFKQARPNAEGGDTFDLEFNGKRFDVKYSSFNGYNKFLRVHALELPKPMDAYILTGIKESRVIVYGYAWKNEVLSGEERNFGYGNNKVIPVEALHPLEVWISKGGD